MTRSIRIALPALAFALCSTALLGAGAARAEDAMKPADSMKTEAMKPMKGDDKMMADCKEKAGMETDSMKKEEAMKACEDMGGKDLGGGMMKSDDAMKPKSE